MPHNLCHLIAPLVICVIIVVLGCEYIFTYNRSFVPIWLECYLCINFFFSQGFHIEASVFLKSQIKNFVSNNSSFFQNFWELIITKKNISWNDWNNMKIEIRLRKEFGRILRFASGSICKYAVIILSSLILKLSGLEMGLHVYDGRDSVVLCINYKQKLSLNNDARRHRITM